MNIRKLRGIMAEEGITQKDIADAIGKSANTVTKCFNGKRSFGIDEVDKICGLLGITDNLKKSEIFLTNSSQK